jgi:hypothetical protein
MKDKANWCINLKQNNGSFELENLDDPVRDKTKPKPIRADILFRIPKGTVLYSGIVNYPGENHPHILKTDLDCRNKKYCEYANVWINLCLLVPKEMTMGLVKNKSSPSEKETPQETSNDQDKITPAQRKYLFRLLAEKKNIKGEMAEENLKHLLKVQIINDALKKSASDLIQELLDDAGRIMD